MDQPFELHNAETGQTSPWRVCVAPMLDWTDRHCRYLHRLITRHTRLYTEMVTTGAILHGDQARHLDFSAAEQPLALQLGGSDPHDLAVCASLAERWGYDELNLNCGCPSPRVQRGAFGAALMADPHRVADCVRAMREAVTIPVTVKHRIGLDANDSYDDVHNFVATVSEKGGCQVFIVHARNAWLDGLSPKENRDIPPLRYEYVYRLKRDFPHLHVVLNGGVADAAAMAYHLRHVDGVMIGRWAYRNPWVMAEWDSLFWRHQRVKDAVDSRVTSREAVESAWVQYLEGLHQTGQNWGTAMRHAMGLRNGLAGARRWRQTWSDHRLQASCSPRVVQNMVDSLSL